MSDTRADPIRQHIRELRGMADYAVRGQIVCSDVAMRSWADALESALDGLLADAAELRENFKRNLRLGTEEVRAQRDEALARVAALEAKAEVNRIKGLSPEDAERYFHERNQQADRVAALETALREFFAEFDHPEHGRYAPTDDTEALMRAALAASTPAEETT